jgi:hypothetical protein
MLREFERLMNYLYNLAIRGSFYALVVIVLMNTDNLFLRSFLNRPIEWILEISFISDVQNRKVSGNAIIEPLFSSFYPQWHDSAEVLLRWKGGGNSASSVKRENYLPPWNQARF